MSVRVMSDEGVLKAFDQARERAYMEIEGGPEISTQEVVNRIRELMPYFLGGSE